MIYIQHLTIYINEGWLENLGLDRPKTLDDLYDVLKAFKEQDANGNGDPNDESPLGFRKNSYHVDTKYGEEIAKFVDYLFTEEGQLSARNGYDGVTFDYNEIVPGYLVPDHTAKENGFENINDYCQQKALALDAVSIVVSNLGTVYDGLDEVDVYDDKVYEQLNTII